MIGPRLRKHGALIEEISPQIRPRYLVADGMLQDRFGHLERRFRAALSEPVP